MTISTATAFELYAKFDILIGRFFLTCNIIGGIGSGISHFSPEFGLSFILSESLRTQSMKRIDAGSYESGRTLTHKYITRYSWSQKYSGKALNMNLIEIGVKLQSPVYYKEEVDHESTQLIYGKSYTNVEIIKTWKRDKILYFGYRYMAIRQKALTVSEFLFHIRGMVGFVDREKFIDRYWSFDDDITLIKTGEIALGAEAAIKWHKFHAKVGFYDDEFYFGMGFRIGFQIGL